MSDKNGLDFFNAVAGKAGDSKPSHSTQPGVPGAIPEVAVPAAGSKRLVTAGLVAGAVAILGIGASMFGGQSAAPVAPIAAAGAPAPVASAATTPTAPVAPDAAAVPGVAPAVAVAAVSTDLSASDAVLLKRVRQADQVEKMLKPEDMKSCETLLTIVRDSTGGSASQHFYLNKCQEVGAATYYKCSPSGIAWNPSLPGCAIN